MLPAIIIVTLFGLALGSFANCLIWRLYKQEKISGRSYCPLCRRQLRWYDNIPLLSYLFLRGRCRFCRQRISWQYPAVELLTAVLFVFFWCKYLGFTWLAPEALAAGLHTAVFWLLVGRAWLAVWSLVVIFVFDLRFYLIPNAVVIPVTAAFILINLLLGAPWLLLLATMAAAVAFFGSQFILTRGRGLGEGDIWLGLLLGALFPDWGLLIAAVLAAYFAGTIVGLSLIAAGHKSWGSKLPLGVFLAFGAIFALAWGQGLIAAYQAWL